MNQDVYSSRGIRCAAWQFLSAKAVSAMLTFMILLCLVRLLPVAEYGAYVVLIAGTELGFAIAGMGLPWLAARYLPEYRLHATGPILARLCRQLLLWQFLALMVLAGIIALAMDAYLHWAGLAVHRGAAWFALALLVTEGLARFVREGLMAPLMLQGQARVSLILRQASFLAATAALSFASRPELIWVLAAEVAASFASCLVATLALGWHLGSLRGQNGVTGWQEPGIADQWRVATRMHITRLISLAYSQPVLINLVQRSLGAEAAALFGFLRTLYEQIARYLPATLLFTVIRPKLMASHLQVGMSDLARSVNFVGKLSLFVLLPIIVLVALGGDGLVSLLSGGKFTYGWSLLLGLLLALVPCSQRQLLETVAVASGRSGLCALSSAIGLLAMPLMIYLIDQGLGLWAPVLATLFGQFVLNTTLLLGLFQIGYRADWRGAIKLVASAILAGIVAGGVSSRESVMIWLALAWFVAVVVFLAMAWWLNAFTQEERQRLDGLIGRQLFAR